MEREQLERLLGGGDDTSLAALSALRASASHVVWDGTTSAESLAAVYGRRLRHTVRRGIKTSGLARAVQRLGLTADRFDWARSGLPTDHGSSCCFSMRTAARWWRAPAFNRPNPARDDQTPTEALHCRHAFQLWWWGRGVCAGAFTWVHVRPTAVAEPPLGPHGTSVHGAERDGNRDGPQHRSPTSSKAVATRHAHDVHALGDPRPVRLRSQTRPQVGYRCVRTACAHSALSHDPYHGRPYPKRRSAQRVCHLPTRQKRT